MKWIFQQQKIVGNCRFSEMIAQECVVTNAFRGIGQTAPNSMLYKLSVHGCDDSTHVFMELTANEAQLLVRVAQRITRTSECQCQPTMDIQRATPDEVKELEESEQ
jgi:hypothetical protein